MKPVHGQPAYVLHVRPYRETSVLVTSFTQDHGKVNLLAKGVRSAKSPMKALLQPFVPLLISFQGRHELKYLNQCEMHGDWHMLRHHRIASGLYLNELLYKLLAPGLEHRSLFEKYRETLCALANAESDLPALRLFEKQLLDELGYALTLTHDVDGATIEETKRYTFLPQSGARPVDSGDKHGVSGQTLLDLSRHDLSHPVTVRETTILLKPVLKQLLGE